jgi:signal transduction histidine kinase
MRRSPRHGYSPARLRLLLVLLLLALAVPSAVLVWQTQLQLRWESLHQYRTLAEELATRIDIELQRLIAAEEARAESDYQYLVVAGDPSTSNMVQRSPLAQLPVAGGFPGLVGHFEVDAEGRFSTPLLPESVGDKEDLGLDDRELAQRVALRQQLLDVLGRNQMVAAARERLLADQQAGASTQAGSSDSRAVTESNGASYAKAEGDYQGQAAFDQLNSTATSSTRQQVGQLGRVDELRLGRAYVESGKKDQGRRVAADEVQALSNAVVRGKRKEQGALLEQIATDDLDDAKTNSGRVRIFESEVDPFEFALLASGHGVLFRKVWRDGQRTIQGVLIDQNAFVDGVIATTFRGTALWEMSDLVVAWQEQVLRLIPGAAQGRRLSSAREVSGELLYQTRLSAPLDRLQLIWSIKRLPAGPGARIVYWASAILFAVLLGGLYLLYRLGLRQILLARQQQDFVSAVSHELKTPLTSIRMYAEMLREGWASEDKKRSYYAFIFDESERLSRLIANVLQLARMERSDFRLDLKAVRIASLMDLLRSKIHTQIERAGFAVEYRIDAACAETEITVDADAFSQILINLVDNAIKFSLAAPVHRLEISVFCNSSAVIISVRDYGPGVPRAQMKKIFQLFYRSGSELTRESLGTGIGLALARQLAQAMGGEIDVVNREPGAEFQLRLPLQERRARRDR